MAETSYILYPVRQGTFILRTAGLLFCLIGWVTLIMIASLESSLFYIFYLGLLVPLSLVIQYIFRERFSWANGYSVPLIITGSIFLLLPPMSFLFFIFLVYAWLDRRSWRPEKIVVSDEGILIDAFIPVRNHWKNLSNVVLKDDLLTLDFRNNRILHRRLDPSLNIVNEAEFNRYCRERLID